MTTQRFEMTEGHLRLLERAYVRWGEMEWGAPEIDGKRPYGNGDIHEDIAEILGRTDLLDQDGCVPDRHRADLFAIHRQTEWALQIVLRERAFQPGVFERESSWSPWKRVV